MPLYKKLFHTDFESVFNVRYIAHNEIGDKRILTWNIRDDKEYTINPLLNERLEYRYGELIGKGYHALMSIRWVNKKVGYGAYAEQPIKKGDMVVEYTGIIQEDIPFDNDNLYLWDYPTIIYQTVPGKKRRRGVKFCINAQDVGNYARFINHSLHKYQNVAIQVVPHNKLWHVVYVAQKDIKKGEQLLTHYGVSYWRDRNIVPEPIIPEQYR